MALALHHGELCLICREGVSHTTSPAFPWAFPCPQVICKATLAHCTAYCQIRFELKHWSPSMFCSQPLPGGFYLICLTAVVVAVDAIQGRSHGVLGRRAALQRLGAWGHTAAARPNVWLSPGPHSSAPQKPWAESISTRASHHRKK